MMGASERTVATWEKERCHARTSDGALWFTGHLGKTLVRSPARGPGLSFRIDVAVAQRETGQAARMGGEG